MKKTFKLLYLAMNKFEEVVTESMLFVTIMVTVINVLARYLFKSSIPWAQEVSGIAWTWTVMLGISWCFRRNSHMGVDFLVDKLPPQYRKWTYILHFSILTVAFVFMTYMSVIITKLGGYKLTNYFKIPYAIKYISAVIAFINMTIYSICFLVTAIRKPEEFLKRVSLEGNGLDDFDEVVDIDGIPDDELMLKGEKNI